jgi:hypothetical protein
MKWMREHGLIATYADYAALPSTVAQHARLARNAEVEHRNAEASKAHAENMRKKRGMR